jgi:hypothetical protein
MTPACTSEPVSFLRLERYLQGDLQVPELERVSAHLRECPACSACFDALRSEVIELPPLQLPKQIARPARKLAPSWRWPLAMLAAAAALLFALRPRDVTAPAARVRIKGGELAIELVREHGAGLANDASLFAPGDRFAVRVSCPPQPAAYWDVAVFQAGEVFFPLSAERRVRCANGVTLPGAFELSGSLEALVCVQVDSQPLDRQRVERAGIAGLAHSSACTRVAPAQHQR